MEKALAQHYTEVHKDITASELRERLDEIIDEIDANPDTVYHVVDEQGRRFVMLSHVRFQTLQAGATFEGVSTTPSDPSETSRT